MGTDKRPTNARYRGNSGFFILPSAVCLSQLPPPAAFDATIRSSGRFSFDPYWLVLTVR